MYYTSEIKKNCLSKAIPFMEEVVQAVQSSAAYINANEYHILSQQLQNKVNQYSSNIQTIKSEIDQSDTISNQIIKRCESLAEIGQRIAMQSNRIANMLDKRPDRIDVAHESLPSMTYQSQINGYDKVWEIAYLRPSTEQDKSEREQALQTFSEKIGTTHTENDITLFHGTSLNRAEQILNSNGIMDSSERIGRTTSQDAPGLFSVTNSNNIYITINGFTHLQTNFNLPAGVVFAIKANSPEEAKQCGDKTQYPNMTFGDNYERIEALITTSENKQTLEEKYPNLQGKIMTFDEYIQDREQRIEQEMEQESFGYGTDDLDQTQIKFVYNINLPLYQGADQFEVFKKLYGDKTEDTGLDRLAGYSHHREDHIKQVCEKTMETLTAFEQALEYDVKNSNTSTFNIMENYSFDKTVVFKEGIEPNVMAAAALAHDTGMGHAIFFKDGQNVSEINIEIDNFENFNKVRSSHPLNSAINVLINRDEYKKVGFSDKQIDKIALLCMTHSKSTSGIRNLTNETQWKQCIELLNTAIQLYNDNPNNTINIKADFDTLINDKNELGKLALGSLALRVGDVSRDAKEIDKTQSLDYYTAPDYDSLPIQQNLTIEEMAKIVKNPELELEKATLNLVDKDGKILRKIKDEPTKRMRFGEQAIAENHTYFDKEAGEIVHTCKLSANALKTPHATLQALKEHWDEFATSMNTRFKMNVEFDAETLENMSVKTRKMFDKYKSLMKHENMLSKNMSIQFPWNISTDTRTLNPYVTIMEVKGQYHILGVSSNQELAKLKKDGYEHFVSNSEEELGFPAGELQNACKIQIYEIQGEQLPSNTNFVQFDIKQLPSGEYICDNLQPSINSSQDRIIDIIDDTHIGNCSETCKLNSYDDATAYRNITEMLGVKNMYRENLQEMLFHAGQTAGDSEPAQSLGQNLEEVR